MVEKIKSLCEKHGTSIKALERELDFGNGTIRRWDDSAPSIDKVLKVADFFNCSIDVLICPGEEEQKEKPALDSGPNKALLLRWIDEMSREQLIETLQAVTKKLSEDK